MRRDFPALLLSSSHQAPPFSLLGRLLFDMATYLATDQRNVCVVHCLAGKGRTGVTLVSFLLLSGLFPDPTSARAFYAAQRSRAHWGVAQPAQVRYIGYLDNILKESEVRHLPDHC